MKNYNTPKVEIILLKSNDVILASLGNAENDLTDIFSVETLW